MSVIMRGGPSRVAWPWAVSVLVEPPAFEPLTLDEAKLRAGLDWVDGDPRDTLMLSFIAAARARVEQDTGLALLTQTRELHYTGLPSGTNGLPLPAQAWPVQTITSLITVDGALDPTTYRLDRVTERIALAAGAAWPTTLDPGPVVTVVVGWPSAAALPPDLRQAVGLLAAHMATAGRDVVMVGTIVAQMPYGYDEAIAPHRRVSLL